MTAAEIQEQEILQRAVCRRFGQEFLPSTKDSKLGFAIDTTGQQPVNGLRHPPSGDTNGWYIWCGPQLSDDPEFFSPIHTQHLEQRCPEVLKYLGLPPGCRFLIAPGHEDVWFDPTLLDV